MTGDTWPIIILMMTIGVSLRPGRATLVLSEGTSSAAAGRTSLAQAGGGLAMLAMAVYLLAQCRQATGLGYWDMPLQALQNPYMRGITGVWLPAVCWLCLAALGSWWLLAGTRGSRVPRDLTGVIFAVNEIAIVGTLLLRNVTVPESWPQAYLLSFAMHGVYLSYLAGAALRLMLALASFVLPPAEPPAVRPSRRANSSLRRH
jgi:hypothetical protein